MSELNKVCCSYDDYLQDKDEAIWIVELMDGTKVYCDDGRYGELDRAWNRLRNYLSQYNNPIQRLYIKFRSHTELVATRDKDTVGFYFGRSAGAWFGQNTSHFFIVGTVQQVDEWGLEQVAKTSKWRVPEVIREQDGDENRNPRSYVENIIWD